MSGAVKTTKQNRPKHKQVIMEENENNQRLQRMKVGNVVAPASITSIGSIERTNRRSSNRCLASRKCHTAYAPIQPQRERQWNEFHDFLTFTKKSLPPMFRNRQIADDLDLGVQSSLFDSRFRISLRRQMGFSLLFHSTKSVWFTHTRTHFLLTFCSFVTSHFHLIPSRITIARSKFAVQTDRYCTGMVSR